LGHPPNYPHTNPNSAEREEVYWEKPKSHIANRQGLKRLYSSTPNPVELDGKGCIGKNPIPTLKIDKD